MKKFDRRLLLKAAAGAPLLSLLGSRSVLADPGRPPKRVIFWFQPNGVAHHHYHARPGSTEHDWGYDGDDHSLKPLIPFQDLAVHFDSSDRVASLALPPDEWRRWVDGTKLPFGLSDLAGCVGPNPLKPLDAEGNPTRELTIGHESQVAMLTGRYPQGEVVTDANGSSTLVWHAQGDSIDVALGKALGGGTRLKSVQLGLNGYVNFGLSYDGGARLPVLDDARLSFQTLFAGIPHEPGVDPQALALQQQMSRRRASFEVAWQRFSALKGGLHPVDAQRLQQHLEAYQAVEARLTQAPDLTNLACHSPDQPAPINGNDPLAYPSRVGTMIEQLTLALACDVTRVVTMSWTFAATNQSFGFLPGFTSSTDAGTPTSDLHHPLSHDSYNGIDEPVTTLQLASYEKKRRIERWYAEQLAALLTSLRNVTEPDGSTLLDNTVVVVLNEINHSGAHNNSNLPIRLYGSCQGALRTGRYLALPATPLNDLYVTLANALGLPWTTFGEARFDYRYAGAPTGWHWVADSKTVGVIPGLLT